MWSATQRGTFLPEVRGGYAKRGGIRPASVTATIGASAAVPNRSLAQRRSREASEQAKPGEVLVFNFSVDQHAAEEQMRLNAKALSILGDTQGLAGIGDQAFVSADGMIMVRKGKNLIRIMFVPCPCGVKAVKSLAKEIADALQRD